MAEKERQMNKKVNLLSAKLKAEEEEVCKVYRARPFVGPGIFFTSNPPLLGS